MSAKRTWQADFLHNLQVRDTREKAFDEIIRNYQALARRPPTNQETIQLRQQIARLERRCRDLEHEVKAKDQEAQRVQDDMLVLSMECDQAVRREQETRRENQELVKRLVDMKEQQVEEMNRVSQWK